MERVRVGARVEVEQAFHFRPSSNTIFVLLYFSFCCCFPPIKKHQTYGGAAYRGRATAVISPCIAGRINRPFTCYPANLIKAIAKPSSLPGSNDLRDSTAGPSTGRSLLRPGRSIVRFAVRPAAVSATKTGRKKPAGTNRDPLGDRTGA